MQTISPHPAASTGFQPETGDTPRVLILGSFPSIQSLRHTEYYGNPQNHFWKIMESLFEIDHRLPYRDRVALLTGHHIALWDVVCSCSRKGSADEKIKEPVVNDIGGFLATHPTVQLIVLNGTAAGRYYHRKNPAPAVGSTILPSTSPANTRYTLAEKIKAWDIVRVILKKEE
ncbi:MAG: DNA-deoxyinosine glycosylase [Methanomicrobiales archaeon HGW-Methanomicrobiales-1]|jgi:TDG/mug DNA glycosylase family protein|nr:MAG: DNA-deoxyinosine glycosylase [Methanomicrobiales archaeon HGW-Methanomicrobiales-1]